MKNQQVELDQRALIAGPDPHENFKRADYKEVWQSTWNFFF